MPLSDADTSRIFIISKLQASGWDDETLRKLLRERVEL
jgi:hypothetical protein